MYRKISLSGSVWAFLMLALAALMGVFLYHEILHFTFYWDDVNFIRVIQEKSLVEIFTTRSALTHYRPLALVPLKLTEDPTGRVPAVPMHLLALILHIVNGWMVGLVAWRIWPEKRGYHLLAALLYVANPFSYQVVPWTAAMEHISAVTGVLMALLFAERWWKGRRWIDFVLTLVGIFIATFSHEAEVISGTVIALWSFVTHYDLSFRRLRENWRPAAQILLPAFAINLFYIAIWPFLTTNPYPVQDRMMSLIRNPVYFLQALTYPISQFGYRLGQQWNFSDYPVALILSVVGLAVLIVGLWLAKNRRVWFVAAWFVAGAAIPIVFLDWNYVLDSPRVLQHVAPAVALGWGLALTALWDRGANALRGDVRGGILRTASLMLGLLALIGGVVFVRTRMEMQEQIDRLYHDIYARIEQSHSSEAIFFNIPAWISLRQRVFALGTEGVVYKADYFAFYDLVAVNTGLEYRTRPLLWQDNLPINEAYWMAYVNEAQPGTEERIAAVRGADHVYRVKALPHGLVLEEAHPAPNADLSEGLTLSNGATLVPRATLDARRNVVNVSLILRTVEGHVEEKVFVHLLCGDQILDQANGALLAEIYPYDYWSAGETWEETRVIEVPAGTSKDCLQVRIGMYHPVTGVRPSLSDGSEWTVISVQNP